MKVIFVTTDVFLGKEGEATEDRLVENAVGMVRDGANDLAIQIRVKDAGNTPQRRRGGGQQTNLRHSCGVVLRHCGVDRIGCVFAEKMSTRL